jgi:outer membrane lipoprotein-sorting protein
MKKLHKIFLLILPAVILSGCGFHKVRGNGELVSKNVSVTDFNSIDASGAFRIIVGFGEKPSVEIITDSNLMKFVEVKVRNEKLFLSTRKNLSPTKSLTVKVVTSTLYSVDLSGANNMIVNGIDSEVFALDISGAAEAKLIGRVDLFKVDLSGAADLDAEKLISKTTKIQVSGAANATVNVSNALYADVTGAADLVYVGSPMIIRQKVSGAGSIRKK